MLQDTFTVISILAALVAALSAVYASWQAQAAKRANSIALHDSRLSVYKGIVRFRAYISARGTDIKEDEVWKFAEVSESGEFYFPAPIHARLESVFERALQLLSLNDDWENAKNAGLIDQEVAKALNQKRHTLMREIRDDCYAISNELKKHLRVGET